jgi:hypothetical protein
LSISSAFAIDRHQAERDGPVNLSGGGGLSPQRPCNRAIQKKGK